MFAPDGTVHAMAVNTPGAMHDSTLMLLSGMYDTCKEWANELTVKFVVDSAFRCIDQPHFIRSSQNPVLTDDPLSVIIAAQATSVRQMAEWGMRGFQASFPRVKDQMRFEERGERHLIMQLIARLYNYRVNKVGINQIRNTFVPSLERNALQFNV